MRKPFDIIEILRTLYRIGTNQFTSCLMMLIAPWDD